MNNQTTDPQKIKAIAITIAQEIMSVNTDFRGNLLVHVANELRSNIQGYTAKCIEAAATQYGVK
jgi:hypothetical protein